MAKIFTIYGDGKNKTSSLNGMVIRAMGANKKIAYIRFLKNRPTSEDKIFRKLGLEINSFYKKSTKFIWEMNESEIEIFKKETYEGFLFLVKIVENNEFDFIFCDEILGAVENHFIDKNELLSVLRNKYCKSNIVLTGRKVFEGLIENSDLVSEIKNIKHYFESGVQAEEGIEF